MNGFTLSGIRFLLNLMIASAPFSHPLKKRERLPLRLLLGLVSSMVFAVLVPNTTLQFFVITALVAGIVFLCCESSVLDCIYCVACGYATQHFSSCLYTVLRLRGIEQNDFRPPKITILLLLCDVTVYTLFYFLFARKMGNGEGYLLDTKQSAVSTALMLTAALILSVAKGDAQTPREEWLLMMCELYDMLFCAVILWMQVSMIQRVQLEREMALQTQLSEQQKEQYTLTRETIEIINRKCHDMKHQVAALRQMQQTEARDAYCREVENSIQIYDSTIQTGSEVLDTVLTGKSLYCEAHQIVLTCVADGEKLAFLDPMDLYTIFGNALDNAIESVSQVEDAEKRLISVSIWERNGLVLIQMENYYEGELTQNTQTGLPATTKNSPENHGFGLKSILSTIEKYQGHMTIHTENSIFILRISFPKVKRE
jgi:hypothetical protein